MAIYTPVNGKWSIYPMLAQGSTDNTVTVTIPPERDEQTT